ncbi:Outer membrane protein A precursor [Labilithrix luteola]|uniref:Outer membrane protein A n=1 Tax=Labilithrix luteola TaxID=1391654 RepID=A0A0K1PKE3_9BACT|nr:OmpA family protein [Labilithrix luteola]AKU94000.1 Outer membrane protein A precursor [Labilithrix luteola]
MIRFTGSVITLALVTAVGCASSKAVAPPPELAEAKAAYAQAANGAAAQVNTAGLFEARKALDTAEQRQQQEPGAPETRDMAYIALRKSQRAEVEAQAAIAEREAQQAAVTIQQLQGERTAGNEASAELRAKSEAQQPNLQEEKDAERARGLRAKTALDNLGIASVKQDERGMVINLAGADLFAMNQSSLSSAAQDRLKPVARTLSQMPGHPIVVEGFTDNTGTDERNLELSKARAESVREYLVSQGVEANRIRAEGRGNTSPVAGNDTPEGRALNRRVEIIVQEGASQPR